MKLAIIDLLGLTYDGDTLTKRGLGGSESAVILMSRELTKIGFDVTVFNNCIDSEASPGTYSGVRYIDHSQFEDGELFDVVISSRSVFPFFDNNKYNALCANAKHKVVWMHDTFCEGDQHIEDMINQGFIDELFTLSDFHTTYVTNCDHGNKRNFEVLKHKIFQTRNGAVKWIDEVNLHEKNRSHFVFNASVTKGLTPLIEDIWPTVKEYIKDARLTVIGGFYRFRDGAEPDEQEKTLRCYMETVSDDLDITFTGVIPQYEIAEILANAGFMIYPTDFPETFGISTLESLLYNTPVITCNFGALNETAIDLACYKIDYACMPNGLFPNIQRKGQADKFWKKVVEAHNDTYLYQQKQQYCGIIDDIYGWDTVALQWKQHLYYKLEKYLSVDEYRKVSYINDKVARIYGRRFNNPVDRIQYRSYTDQKRIVIISPYWNADNYIVEHCQSIDQQDYNNYLHVVIDDCSDNVIELPENPKRIVIRNNERKGCIQNQLMVFDKYVEDDDIVILLDGDDFLVSNNTIFHYYNNLFDKGYKFTYGSCWSLADEIPLISQEYPSEVHENKTYRNYHFAWKIPYTHLRTFSGSLVKSLDRNVFMKDGEFMMSGMDNPLFYELLEQCEPQEIKAVKEIVCYYNDVNPLNDYKVSPDQDQNAAVSYKEKNEMKRILIALPTNKNVETETFKSIYDQIIPEGYKTQLEFFYGYQVDQVRNLIADWGKRYDYLFCVDSDIVLPKDALSKLLKADKDIISGVYIQRIPGKRIVELYEDYQGGQRNILIDEIPEGLMKVSACGFGCVLIKGHVLNTMEYPHFLYKSALDHNFTYSEDTFFCNKAKESGFEIWADTTIQCGHKGTQFFDPNITYKSDVQPQEFDKEQRLRELGSQRLIPKNHVDYLHELGKEFKPKVIYDIGACVLHWTQEAEKVWPKSQIIAFEAMEECSFLYQERKMKYVCNPLSDKDEKKVQFYKNVYHPGGNSYYKQNEEIVHDTNEYFPESTKQELTSFTLDTIVKMTEFPPPDLIKMDVQGAELDILKGASKTLESVQHLILECQSVEYNKGAPMAQDVIDYLKDIGFELISKFSDQGPDADYHFKKI